MSATSAATRKSEPKLITLIYRKKTCASQQTNQPLKITNSCHKKIGCIFVQTKLIKMEESIAFFKHELFHK